jgi:MarR family transcriptional regulator, lower aerobic nicotinate degradation pathway regulator
VTSQERTELDGSLGFNLDRVAKLYRRELIRALADYGLSPEQWQVISALSARKNGLSQAEIAALTSTDKHSMSRMLGRMQRAGWVHRTGDPEDARAFRVTLARPPADVDSLRVALRKHFSRINSALTESKQRRLLGLLKTLRTHFEV